MRKLLFVVLGLCSINANAIEVDRDYTCTQMFYDHGIASTASDKCGLKYINTDIASQTKKCFALARQTGSRTQLTNALTSGVITFSQAYKTNKQSSCNQVLLDFPDYLDK